MIKILHSRGVSAPVFICDECAQRIDNAGGAAVVLAPSSTDGELTDTWFVHKGACHDKAESRHGRGGWQEMRHFLVYLAANVGLNPAEFAAAADTADAMGRIR